MMASAAASRSIAAWTSSSAKPATAARAVHGQRPEFDHARRRRGTGMLEEVEGLLGDAVGEHPRRRRVAGARAHDDDDRRLGIGRRSADMARRRPGHAAIAGSLSW
jgi:hypothetical protein